MFRPRGSSQVRRLVERDGTRCHYCGVELLFEGSDNEPDYRTIDHMKPQSQGGKSLLENLVLACRVCNSLKHTQHYQEFLMKRQTNSIILWLMDGES